jgi:peroxiredoxin
MSVNGKDTGAARSNNSSSEATTKATEKKTPRASNEQRCALRELRGLVRVAEGDVAGGLDDLREAWNIYRTRITGNDPHPYPRPVCEPLARACLAAGKWDEAEQVLRAGLKREPNNGFALALLAETLARANKPADAQGALASLRRAWTHADPDLLALQRLRALGHTLNPTPAPVGDRAKHGPGRWQPFPAPASVSVHDPSGKSVPLSPAPGRNLVLVFYLGGECKHCMEQLTGLGKEKAAFAALGTDIAAVSWDKPEANRAFLAANSDYPLQTLLSDTNSRAAKAFGAHDDFESRDLHATYLVDKRGRVWWFRAGSEPFTDFAFLKAEISRMNDWLAQEQSSQSKSTRTAGSWRGLEQRRAGRG